MSMEQQDMVQEHQSNINEQGNVCNIQDVVMEQAQVCTPTVSSEVRTPTVPSEVHTPTVPSEVHTPTVPSECNFRLTPSLELSYTPGGSDLWIRKIEMEFTPKVGMLFKTVKEGTDFYRMYALACGFKSRLSTAKTFRDGKIRSKAIVCNRQGFKERRKKTSTIYGKQQHCTFYGKQQHGAWKQTTSQRSEED
ncbi:hypothetical protein RND81_04G113500 [Saponaria officinalis]|uniref:FAR1 domain-containing protein n=1 Tax=Saponaria officinalis TaxID=3572 RepID=A0AAW1LJW0_SAPOF